jgi:hypothetical protein
MHLLSQRKLEAIFEDAANHYGKAERLFGYALILIIVLCFLSNIGAGALLRTVTIYSSGKLTYSSTLALHVEGQYIKDSVGQIVALRGVNYAYFIDSGSGSWVLPSGSIEWLTWDPVAMAQNVEAMNSWGCNVVRTMATTEWWIKNTDGFRSNFELCLTKLEEQGMYVILSFWRNNGSEPYIGVPYEDPGNGYINTPQDFVNFWADIANNLKGYPNVIFEFWNEPTTTNETLWMSTVQQCIGAIRSTGATNVILVQMGYGIGINIDWPPPNAAGTLEWVIKYPLADPLGNIAYSTHLYRDSFFNSTDNYAQTYTLQDMNYSLTVASVFSVAKQYPLIVGEIGASAWWEPGSQDEAKEYAWFNNTLSLLNQNGIGYCGWWWWPLGKFQMLVTGAPNFQPNQAGTILKNAIANATGFPSP